MEQNIENIEKLKGLVNNIGIGMLVTVNETKKLNSRPISTADIDIEGNIWFFTDEFSDKAEKISYNDKVMITYSSPVLKSCISIYGNAMLVNDIDQIKDLWSPAFKPWFPESEMDDAVKLLKVSPSHIEYWDGGSLKTVISPNTENAYKAMDYNYLKSLNY